MAGSPENLTFDLTGSPSHLLHRAQQFAAGRFVGEMGKKSPITQRQFAVLSAVAANEGLTQTELVRATGIDRSTLAELVSRMVGKKLLQRQRAKADARANTVRLTAVGRDLLVRTRARVEAADAAIMDALPKNKRAAFLDTLQRISRELDGADAAADAPPADEVKPEKKKAKKAKSKKADAKAEKKTAQPAKSTKTSRTKKQAEKSVAAKASSKGRKKKGAKAA